MIVDTHVHIVAEDRGRYPLNPEGPTLGWYNEAPVTVEGLIALMDEAGVDRATLVQALSAYGYDNRYVADSARAHPDRCTAVCILDVEDEGAADQLDHLVRSGNVTGLRLFTYSKPDADWLADRKTFPAWERAASLNIPITILLHPPKFPQLRDVLGRFPGVPVAVEHLAHVELDDGPPYRKAQGLFDLADIPNLNLKFSSANLYGDRGARDPKDFFRKLVDVFGAERLIWGSNFPATYDRSYPDQVRVARETLAFLPESDQRMILGENALRLYPSLRGDA
jgi:predicted TIM-barrel fold metal-dependent hydrolase